MGGDVYFGVEVIKITEKEGWAIERTFIILVKFRSLCN